MNEIRPLVSLSVTPEVRNELRKQAHKQGRTLDEFLRGKLGLPARKESKAARASRIPLRDGTKLEATYKGRVYHATVKNGQVLYKGKTYTPTGAAQAVVKKTGSTPSGWAFWHVKKAGKLVALGSVGSTTKARKVKASAKTPASATPEAPELVSTTKPEEEPEEEVVSAEEVVVETGPTEEAPEEPAGEDPFQQESEIPDGPSEATES